MQGQMFSGFSDLEAVQRKRRHARKLLQRRLADVAPRRRAELCLHAVELPHRPYLEAAEDARKAAEERARARSQLCET